MTRVAVVGDKGSYPLQFANALSRIPGCEVIFYGPRRAPMGTVKRLVAFDGFPNQRQVWTSFWYFLQIPFAAIRDRAQVVHIDFTFTTFGSSYLSLLPMAFLLPLLRISLRKVALTIHDVPGKAALLEVFKESRTRLFSSYIFARALFLIIGEASNNLCTHFETQRITLVRELGIGPRKVAVVAFGVDDRPSRDHELRGPLTKIPREKKVVLFFGTIGPRKGIEYLIEGLWQITESVPNAILVIAGPVDAKYKAYNEGISQLGRKLLGSKFLSLGYLRPGEAHQVIELSSVLVLPYVYSYASPSILYWAIQHRKPVIASSVDTLAEELIGYPQSLLVHPRNSADIANALSDLLSHPSLYEEAVSFMRTKAANNSWDSVAQVVYKSYIRAAQRQACPQ